MTAGCTPTHTLLMALLYITLLQAERERKRGRKVLKVDKSGGRGGTGGDGSGDSSSDGEGGSGSSSGEEQLEALHDLDLRVHVDVKSMAAGGWHGCWHRWMGPGLDKRINETVQLRVLQALVVTAIVPAAGRGCAELAKSSAWDRQIDG